MPDISVIIPVAKPHLVYLPAAIGSIQQQSVNCEVIVVNDTGEPMEGATVNTNRRGAGFARNRGVEAATCEAIFFLDADDYLLPGGLDLLWKAYQPCPHIIYGDLLWDGKPYRLRDQYRGSQKERSPLYQPWRPVSCLLPKAYHDQIGGFDETMGSLEDWDYEIKLDIVQGLCATHIPQPIFYYRGASSLRRTDKKAWDEGRALISQKYHKWYHGGKLNMCSSGCGGAVRRVAPQVVLASGGELLEYVGNLKVFTVQGASGRRYNFSSTNKKRRIGEADGEVLPSDASVLVQRRVRGNVLFRIIPNPN